MLLCCFGLPYITRLNAVAIAALRAEDSAETMQKQKTGFEVVVGFVRVGVAAGVGSRDCGA